jgi:polyisoprenoid-binding protein YceI
MKIFTYPLSLVASAGLFLTSCAENPADDVPKADVSEASDSSAVTEAKSDAGADDVVYTFTDASKIGFVGSKVTGSHEGGFKKFSGTFNIAGDQPGAGPHMLEIDMDSTWSDAEKLTGHLKSPDFFNVAEHPSAKFVVENITAAEGVGAYKLDGTLTLRGVTKAISFPAMINKTDDGHVTLESEFAINRKDFDIVYAGKADDLIRDEVVIKLAMVAAPKA